MGLFSNIFGASLRKRIYELEQQLSGVRQDLLTAETKIAELKTEHQKKHHQLTTLLKWVEVTHNIANVEPEGLSVPVDLLKGKL